MKGYVSSLGKSPPSRPSSPSAKTNTSILPAKSVWNVFLPSYLPSWFPMIPNSGYHQLSLVDAIISYHSKLYSDTILSADCSPDLKKKKIYFNGLSLLYRLKTKLPCVTSNFWSLTSACHSAQDPWAFWPPATWTEGNECIFHSVAVTAAPTVPSTERALKALLMI